MIRMIHTLSMFRSRKALTQKYGKDFWIKFKRLSRQKLEKILPLTPDIGESIFSLNYQFGPPYIAWYQALTELGFAQTDAWEVIWLINEKLITFVPKSILQSMGKNSLGNIRKTALAHLQRQEQGKLHPLDWHIVYRDIDDNSCEIDILECGLKKLADRFDASGLLPGICRLDYLMSYYMGTGFERTKTLGDGDDCCNCRYLITGVCEWAPEKGFLNRK